MNTTFTARIRRATLTIAVLAAATAAPVTAARAQSQSQPAPAAVRSHQGPGIGSVKTPPFQDNAYLEQKAGQQQRVLYFHTRDGQSAKKSPQRQGPGSWSVKAPGIH